MLLNRRGVPIRRLLRQFDLLRGVASVSECERTGARLLKYLPALILFKPNKATVESFEGLPKGILPVIPSSASLSASFRIQDGLGRLHTIHHRQFQAVTPGYAFMDYKSQGQTMDYLLVDLENPPGGKLTPFSAECDESGDFQFVGPNFQRIGVDPLPRHGGTASKVEKTNEPMKTNDRVQTSEFNIPGGINVMLTVYFPTRYIDGRVAAVVVNCTSPRWWWLESHLFHCQWSEVEDDATLTPQRRKPSPHQLLNCTIRVGSPPFCYSTLTPIIAGTKISETLEQFILLSAFLRRTSPCDRQRRWTASYL
ncbi:hypothetical protein C8R43DRAFT_958201 [Mycena crocata]|nr:hypothetical protein C8R43DRAFT_958201 [Mycena crocata]